MDDEDGNDEEPLQQKKYHKKSERRLNSFRLPVETLKDPTPTIQRRKGESNGSSP